MLNVLVNMLLLLAIIVVGFLILAVCAVAAFAILKVVYELFIKNSGHGRRL